MITVHTRRPQNFLTRLRAEIMHGHVNTWTIDSDGDYTLSDITNLQRAWFHPEEIQGGVRFSFIGTKSEKITKVAYAKYHSRFANILLTYLDNDFDTIEMSARQSPSDQFE